MTMTKLESILPTHPKIQKFLEARNLDRTMAEEYLRHKDIDKLLASHRLWHRPRIPTFAGALKLYRSRKLRTIKSESKRHHSGKYSATVCCIVRKGKSVVVVLLVVMVVVYLLSGSLYCGL